MRIRFLLGTIAAVTMLASGAMADRSITSEKGVVYAETPFASGSRLVRANETITLTDSCAARIDGKGNGSWQWDAAGTKVTVGAYAIRFDDVPLISLMACAG